MNDLFNISLADAVAEISAAIKHGINLLEKRAKKSEPETETQQQQQYDDEPETIVVSKKKKKHHVLTADLANELLAEDIAAAAIPKKHLKKMSEIKQGQAKRKQIAPMDSDFTVAASAAAAEPLAKISSKKRTKVAAAPLSPPAMPAPMTKGTKKHEFLKSSISAVSLASTSKVATKKPDASASVEVKTANKKRRLEQLPTIEVSKKMKPNKPDVSTNESSKPSKSNGDIPIKPKKKLNILLAKKDNEAASKDKVGAVAIKKVFDTGKMIIPAKPMGFETKSKSSAGQIQQKKRKRAREIIERVVELPKPQWTASGEFTVSSLPSTKRLDVEHCKSTTFNVSVLEPSLSQQKRVKKIPTTIQNTAAKEFLQQAMFKDSVKRESSKQLLQRKAKQVLYTRF